MKVESVQVGRPQAIDYNGNEVMTAFGKMPVAGRLTLRRLGLDGDQQADLVNHGGPDKAVCVYCSEHYSYWENELRHKLSYGAFGENMTVTDMSETDVRIGDIYRLGEAIVQITQPRQPCFKLAHRHGRPDLPELVQQTGFTGYYFRVLNEGELETPQPRIELLEKHPHEITIAFANRIKYHDKRNAEAIRRILSVDALSDGWRKSFEKRLAEL